MNRTWPLSKSTLFIPGLFYEEKAEDFGKFLVLKNK